MKTNTRLPEIIAQHEADLVADWIREQNLVSKQRGLMDEKELRQQCVDFLRALRQATDADADLENFNDAAWDTMKGLLDAVSSSRALQGFSPSEVALFVFSFKKPLFSSIRKQTGKDPETLANELIVASQLIDLAGLYTTEAYQKTREGVIARQQAEMLELSTPVVKLWEGVLALPLIGTLDSARTQVVMETLLQTIVSTGSTVAIIDITGVPMVDTLVAQHLLKTITAARLMGADCIISGIRPQIAQTIVHLGVELNGVITKASLADAFALAMRQLGMEMVAKSTSKTPREDV